MDERRLLLLVAALAGIFVWRLVIRLTPITGEVPVKTCVATLLCALGAFEGILQYRLGESLTAFTMVVGPLFAVGPLLPIALARARLYRFAGGLSAILYWSSDGRDAVSRLLAQVALHYGDTESAIRLSPAGDRLLHAQAFALSAEWAKLLELSLPTEGEPGMAAAAARVEALLMLDRRWQAEAEFERLRTLWQRGPQGPVGYRSLRLSEARLAADRGDIGAVRDQLAQPLQGVMPHRLIAIVAHAADRAGQLEDAIRLYREAYRLAPRGIRPAYAGKLRALGSEPPAAVVEGRSTLATPLLTAGLVLAYGAQVLLDRSASLLPIFGPLEPSTIAAAFMVDLPPIVPSAEAWWRYLSYSLVHANLLHIGFNAWVLFDIGRMYEARRGWGNLIASFAAGTAMGAFISQLADPTGPLVLIGASGGVLGVAGALLADAMASGRREDRQLTGGLLRWMLLIALLSVAIPNVSLWGHVGGVIGGLLWGLVRQGLPASRRVDSVAGTAALGLLIACAAQAVTLALRLFL